MRPWPFLLTLHTCFQTSVLSKPRCGSGLMKAKETLSPLFFYYSFQAWQIPFNHFAVFNHIGMSPVSIWQVPVIWSLKSHKNSNHVALQVITPFTEVTSTWMLRAPGWVQWTWTAVEKKGKTPCMFWVSHIWSTEHLPGCQSFLHIDELWKGPTV